MIAARLGAFTLHESQLKDCVLPSTQPPGAADAVMLVSSASATRWKKGAESQAREAAQSFRVAGVRKTNLARAPTSDYRFEERGGLTQGASDSVLSELS